MPTPTAAALAATLAVRAARARLQAPSEWSRAEAAQELTAQGLPPEAVVAELFAAAYSAPEPCLECHEDQVVEVLSARLLPFLFESEAVHRGVSGLLRDPRGTPARDILFRLWVSPQGQLSEPIRPSPRLLAGRLVSLLRSPPGADASTRTEVRIAVFRALGQLPRLPPLVLPALRALAEASPDSGVDEVVTEEARDLLERVR